MKKIFLSLVLTSNLFAVSDFSDDQITAIENLILIEENKISYEDFREILSSFDERNAVVISGNFPDTILSGNFPNTLLNSNFPNTVLSGNFPNTHISGSVPLSEVLEELELPSPSMN